MTDAVDKATGKVVDIPDAELHEAWKSGAVSLLANRAYQLRLPNGSYGHATGAAVKQALDAGATFAPKTEAEAYFAQKAANAEQDRRESVSGGAPGAFLGEAVSAATGGLADVVLPKQAGLLTKGLQALGVHTAAASPEAAEQGVRDYRAYGREQSPIATAAGGITGFVASAAAVPEIAAEGLAARLGGGVAARIATRAAASGIKATLEGAAIGATQTISDAAIEDHPLTAAHFLANVGGNALWGGALGVGLGALGAGVTALRGAARESAEAAAPSLERALRSSGAADDVGTVAAKAIGVDTPADGLGAKVRDWYSKVAGAVSGKDPEAIKAFTGDVGQKGSAAYENRKLLSEAEEIRDQSMRDLREHGDTLMKASGSTNEIWDRGLKRSYISKLVGDVDSTEAANRSRSLADHAITKLNEMIDDGDTYGNVAASKRTLTVAHDISHKLDKAIAGGDVGEMYALADDLKKAIGKPTSAAARLLPQAMGDELSSLQTRARQMAWKDLYATVQVGLEDEGVWGKMGAAQKQVNQAYSSLIDARKRFNSSLVTDIGRNPEDPWSRAQGIDPGKVGGFVRGLLDPEKDLTHQAVRDYLANTQKLASAFRDSFDLPAAKLAQVEQIGQSAAAFQKTLDKASKTLSLVNQFETIRNVAGGHASMAGAALGTMAHGMGGGIAGLALGKVAGLFTRPADAIMQVARVERMARENGGRIDKTFLGFTRGAKQSTAGVDVGSFARKSAQVRALASQPDALVDRVATNVQPVRDHAPKLADAMVATTMAGLALLKDKLPGAPPGDPLDPGRRPPDPPAAQRVAWLRYYDAVKDPLSVVDDLRDGRLSPEGVEVLKTVYPPLYDQVHQKAFEAMASGKLKDLDPQQRMGLGLLLDLPLPELSPGYITARQAAYAAQPSPDAPPPGGPGGKKTRPINLAKKTPTLAAQRVEAGGT